MASFEKNFAHCIEPLKGWYEQELTKLETYRELPEETILFGCCCWGKAYINTFLNFSIPSLLAPKNLPFFTKKWKVIWIIHTKEEAISTILNHKSYERLLELGVEIHIRIIPHSVFEMIKNPIEKYWILGCGHNIYVQMAKKLGIAYHMVAPDLIYSNGFFTRLDELTKHNDIILHTNLSCSKENCEKELSNHIYSDGSLNIDYLNLSLIGLNNIHPRMNRFVMNQKDFNKQMPSAACLFFFGKKYFHIYCPHYNLFYISKNAIKQAPVLLFNTLDAEIVKFIPKNSKVYIIDERDKINLLELTSFYEEYETSNYDMALFVATFWIASHFEKEYLEYFSHGSRFEIPCDFICNYEPIDDEKISLAINAITKNLDENRIAVYKALPHEDKPNIKEINDLPQT